MTGNGSSFIAKRFTDFIRDQYSHVRIAYRTPTQFGLLECIHRTLKEEEAYWRIYDHPQHAPECLAKFRERYSQRRPHWAFVPEAGGDPWVPAEVYVEGKPTGIPKWQSWAKGAKKKLDELMAEAA